MLAVAAGVPAIAIATYLVASFGSSLPLATAVAIVVAWTALIAAVAIWYGTVAARHLTAPLEALTSSLRQFDPSLGDSGHPALEEGVGEPAETVALKRALRQAVERIGRDRSQKEAVLGGLMHDLKTPLVAQSLLIERLERGDAEEERTVVAELERSSHGAVARLNRLIDVLRVDSSDAYGERTRTDVRTIVDDVVRSLEPLVRARCVILETQGSWIGSVDRAALQRAIENVVANAVRHADRTVGIEVFANVVRVTDDGPGFASAFEDLLDPFRPGPPSIERPAGTAGLGLYIARRSLEAGGGRLKLESSKRGKTVVLLYLGGEA